MAKIAFLYSIPASLVIAYFANDALVEFGKGACDRLSTGNLAYIMNACVEAVKGNAHDMYIGILVACWLVSFVFVSLILQSMQK